MTEAVWRDIPIISKQNLGHSLVEIQRQSVRTMIVHAPLLCGLYIIAQKKSRRAERREMYDSCKIAWQMTVAVCVFSLLFRLSNR